MFGRSKTYRPSIIARVLLARGWTLRISAASPHCIELKTSVEEQLACMELTAVAISKGLIWHSIDIRTRNRAVSLSGLTETAAQELRDDLLAFVNTHLFTIIDADRGHLRDVDAAIKAITDAKRQYLAQSDIARTIAQVPGRASQALAHPLFDIAHLSPTLRSRLPPSIAIVTDPAIRARYNDMFVSAELQALKPLFDDIGGVSLSHEQREACIRLEDNNLLVASAGSGKSATLVGKVAYLLQKGICAPEEILVLAFNRNAAGELRERLARQLNVTSQDLRCRVDTFNALGWSVIRDCEGKPPQLANWVENATSEARVVKRIIDDLMETNAEFREVWAELLVVMPTTEGPESELRNDLDYDTYLAAVEDVKRDERTRPPAETYTTLSQYNVRSREELRIANWLWLNRVDFRYEEQIQIPNRDGKFYSVHPDFFTLRLTPGTSILRST